MTILKIIQNVLENNNNIDYPNFISSLIINLKKKIEKEVVYKNNSIFIEEKNILESKDSTYFSLLLQEIQNTAIELEKSKIKINDLLIGISLNTDQKTNGYFFEISGKRNVVAFLPKNMSYENDFYEQGKNFYLIVEKIDWQSKVSLIVSRNKNILVEKLLCMFCKEVRDDLLNIVSIARIPGKITKILVQPKEKNSFGFLSLIGKNSHIINTISKELKEKIQIFELIPDNIKESYMKLLYPIDIQSIDINDDKVDFYVKEEDFAKTIGKKGSNVYLISKLINKKVTIKIK